MLGGALRPLAMSPSMHSATATEAATEAATEGAATEAATQGAATEAAAGAATAQLADSTPSAAVGSAHTHALSLVEEETNLNADPGMVQCEAKDANDLTGKVGSKELDNKHGSLVAAHDVNAPIGHVDSVHDGKLNDNASCAQKGVGAIDSMYVPATAFSGARPNWVFKLGRMGLGYYPDAQPADSATACKGYTAWSTNPHNPPQNDCTSWVQLSAGLSDAGISGTVPKSHVSSAECAGKRFNREESSAGQEGGGAAFEAQVHTATAESEKQGRQEGKADQAGKEHDKGHYWGQALQYLDSCVQVETISLAAVSCSACIHFACSASGCVLVRSASLH